LYLAAITSQRKYLDRQSRVFIPISYGRFCGFQKQVRLFPTTKRCIKLAKTVASTEELRLNSPFIGLQVQEDVSHVCLHNMLLRSLSFEAY